MRAASRRSTVSARRVLSNAIEKLECRRLLCGLPHEELAPTPAAFDWGIEQQFVNASATMQSNTMRNGGAWNGTRGITSSTAAAANPANKTLGAIEATSFKSIYGAGALFSGETIDTTAVLVKSTYYGDADFNGQVNFDDYSRTDAGFNFGRTGWVNGDYDANVNFDDYSLMDLAFNTQIGGLRNGRPAARPTVESEEGALILA